MLAVGFDMDGRILMTKEVPLVLIMAIHMGSSGLGRAAGSGPGAARTGAPTMEFCQITERQLYNPQGTTRRGALERGGHGELTRGRARINPWHVRCTAERDGGGRSRE